MDNWIGQRIGNYEIIDLLGRGGMATVYRARQLNVQRQVAIKVIKPELTNAENLGQFVARFEREAQTIANLSHPHILKLFDYGRQNDLIYLVMELLSGGSLADRIRREELSLPEIANLLDQIAKALDYAHKQGVIHRDLKPQNVLLDQQGNAILTDFGIAKLLDETKGLTQSGLAMGTPSYMPPEQWQNQPLDGRADVYAVGVMLFEMITRRLPFNADTPFQMMYAHMNETPISVRSLRADATVAVESVIGKALAKRPEARYQTAGELAAAFRLAITGASPSSLGFSASDGDRTAGNPLVPLMADSAENQRSSPKRSRGLIALGAVVLIALLGIGIFALQRASELPTETAAIVPSVPVVALNSTVTPAALSARALTEAVKSSISPSVEATVTPSLTPTATFTIDPRGTAIALFNSDLTLTATQWTLTPTLTFTATPDIPSTINAERTALGHETQMAGLTQTAYVVASFTKTFTPTPTLTSTLTFTFSPTATFTPTPTFTSSNTATFTLTWTSTATITPTPTNTSPPATLTPTNTATSAFTPIPSGSANKLWTPTERDFDGVPMVLVPAGCFMMGSTDAQAKATLNQLLMVGYKQDEAEQTANGEKPIHQVCFDQPFWIDRYEVTNAQFTRFNGNATDPSAGGTGNNQPRTSVTWDEANQFCRSQRAARLPTEAEWEYAARGTESLLYPWGNKLDKSAVYWDQTQQKTVDVGSKPAGRSWVGADDLSGNVFEWINDWYGPYPAEAQLNPQGPTNGTFRIFRGGSWLFHAEGLRTAFRFFRQGDAASFDRGFRCARSVEN